MVKKIAFFDVDHTLTHRSTGYWLAWAAVRAGMVPIVALLSIPFAYLWYRVGPSTNHGGKGQFLPKSIPFLKGIPRSRLKGLARKCFDRHIADDIYREAKDHIATLRKQGTLIVLASTSLDFIIEPISESLGAHAIITNSFEFSNGICTGKFNPPLVFGKSKYDACLNFAKERELSLSDCSFYSDSYHDLPLLLSVGKPYPVNPDRRLRRYAQKTGWEIITYKKNKKLPAPLPAKTLK